MQEVFIARCDHSLTAMQLEVLVLSQVQTWRNDTDEPEIYEAFPAHSELDGTNGFEREYTLRVLYHAPDL